VPFTVKDVSVDREAAQEMVDRTRQMGVPVIADEQEAIVGFDMPRLQRMVARHRSGGGGLGLKVADTPDHSGAHVGGVKESSPAERAGVQTGDVVVELSGRPVNTVTDLERIAALRTPDMPTSMTVLRAGERKTVILPGA
jgi:S1-C subfamily serine protease